MISSSVSHFKIITFQGGLGNQMFQYAFFLAAKRFNRGIWLLDTRECNCHHNGFEINDLFNLGLNLRCFVGKKVLTFIRLFSLDESLKQEMNVYLFDKANFNPNDCLLTIYRGFWQSERYFKNIEYYIRKTFKFPIEKINSQTKAFAEKLKVMDTVSVHIRRGDYLNESVRATCTTSYYDHCINWIVNKCNYVVPVIFSDDIEWCRNNINCKNAIYVDWNKGSNSWQDMYLMSQCNHNIIANSSFSWWGAWLNMNPDKIVMCPRKWNADAPINSDICPKNWVRI